MADNIWAKFINNSQEEVKQYESQNKQFDENGPKVVFLKNGSHKVRFYPEISENSIRIVRKLHIHYADVPNAEGKTRKVRIRCIGEAFCRVCKAVKTVNDQINEWWYWYAPNELGLAYGVIYSSTDTGEWIVKDTPVVLALHRKMVYELNKNGAHLSDPQQAQTLFDPHQAGPVFEIEHKGGSGGNTTVRPSFFEKKELPKFPTEFPKLDDVYIDANSPPSEQDINAAVTQIMQELAEKQSKPVLDPTKAPATPPVGGQLPNSVGSAEASSGSNPVQQNVPFTAPATSTPPSTNTTSVAGIPNVVGPSTLPRNKQKPGNAPMCYAAHPETQNNICLTCQFETSCIQDTIETKFMGVK